MYVITAAENYEPFTKLTSCTTVFLAGGITNCPLWQDKVIAQIRDKWIATEHLVIFNPRRKDFPINDKFAAYQQIQWEYEMLDNCDIFSMYFSSGESDQPICMYELGRNILRMQMRFPSDWQDRIVISVEDGYKRKQDVLIQTQLATNNKIFVNTQVSENICLEYHVENIIKAFKKLRRY